MNQLFIGALDYSPYIQTLNLDNLTRWSVNCWNVPEDMCSRLFCTPIIHVPLYLYFHENIKRGSGSYAGFPAQIVSAEFLFLEYAPYTELNFMFPTKAGRFGFHIKTRLYLALGEGQ